MLLKKSLLSFALALPLASSMAAASEPAPGGMPLPDQSGSSQAEPAQDQAGQTPAPGQSGPDQAPGQSGPAQTPGQSDPAQTPGQGSPDQGPGQGGPAQLPLPGGPEPMELTALRAQCLQMRANGQQRPFELAVTCTGSQTYWQEIPAAYTLPNFARMDTFATTKNGNFQMVRGVFPGILPATAGACGTFIKKRITAPAAVPFIVTQCEELEIAVLHAGCERTLRELCDDRANITDGKGGPGLCVETVENTIDTCAMYQ